MTAPMVECTAVHKQFQDVVALGGVSFGVPQGQFWTLLGPSGCGKTTMLRLIAGFEFPNGGDIRIGGASCVHMPAHKRDVAMVFQGYALFPHRTVLANVMFGLRMRRRGSGPAIERLAREALAMVGLAGFEDRYPRQLSGGQQQRVALARAIVLEPKVLLLDEPLSALDLQLRKAMRYELKRLQRATGLTTIYVTHDQEEAMALSDGIVVMNRGQVEQIGTPHEIYRRPETVFVAEFIGESNLFEATVLGVEGEAIRVRLDRFGDELAIAGARWPAELSRASGTAVALVVRAERLAVSPASEATGLVATVAERAFLGSTTRLYLRYQASERPAVADLAAFSAPPEPGATVRISWPGDETVVVPRT